MKKAFYQAKNLDEAIKIYFQSENELYAQIKNKVMKEVFYSIYDKKLRNSLKVLEVGAGGGIWTEFFIKRGARVTCIDTCEQILKGNAKLHPQAKFILADATTVKLDEKFNLIFAKDVIEHIQDDRQFLKNMNRHLQNKGLIINTQNSWSLNYLVQGIYHFLRGDKTWCGWDPTHIRFYNVKSLKRKLEAEGFEPLKWFGSYYFPYRILADRLKMCINSKVFYFVELIGLYDKFPFRIIGWNIGVVARKIKSI